ncbi:MarR family transcriptional regulator [Halosimplex rubrum]|uniref:MarR family transcriptional regulator n=1 Tax=Halosimplex rubrum TaxID=869889 RepID=A0A7D5P076_9EURY|nr:helix-turn-helix domain-containing protein [Halosimplex rubrum]QLH77437.1 MarR family transcriptional regulator [Halosimplex rubrum]
MANKNFEPTGQQRQVLNVFRDEYQVNPRLIRDVTGLERQRVNDALSALGNAGWIEKRTRGLYRLVYDGEGYVTVELRHKERDR